MTLNRNEAAENRHAAARVRANLNYPAELSETAIYYTYDQPTGQQKLKWRGHSWGMAPRDPLSH
jgi:hypothetical protein